MVLVMIVLILISAFRKSNKTPKYESHQESSNTIEHHMNCAEKDEFRTTTHILLLGLGETGKATIVKQMKRINNIVEPDIVQSKNLAPYIKEEAVFGYIKILCFQSLELHNKYGEKTKVNDENERHLHFILSRKQPYTYDKELATNINTLWLVPAIREMLRLRAKYQIYDNVQHFLDRVILTFDEYLRIRTRSTGQKTILLRRRQIQTMRVNLKNVWQRKPRI